MSRLSLRMPLPSRVVLLAMPQAMRLAVRAALLDHLAVAESNSEVECAQILRSDAGGCVLFRAPSTSENLFGERVIKLRDQFPNTPFVALFDPEISDSRWALNLGKAGVSELVVCSGTVPPQTLLRALSSCATETIAVRIWRLAQPRVSDASMAILKPAIRLGHAPIPLARLALASSLHERSLRKYCEQHGLPSPQWIIGWARLMVAAYYLEEPGRSIQSIVDLVQFSSPVVFSNTTRRYTGQTPSQLRRLEPLKTVSRLLQGALVAHSEMLIEHTTRTRPQRSHLEKVKDAGA